MKIDTLLAAAGPVLHRASLSRAQQRALTSAHAAGRVVRLLPGTYVPRELADDFATRVQAVAAWNARAVVTGAAAARMTFWPTLSVDVIDVALRGRVPDAHGYRFERRRIDLEHVVFVGDVRVAGKRYFIDIAFPEQMLAVEIDGRFHEDDRDVFEEDRFRQNALVRAGWRVLRFTYAMLVHRPEYVVALIRAALVNA